VDRWTDFQVFVRVAEGRRMIRAAHAPNLSPGALDTNATDPAHRRDQERVGAVAHSPFQADHARWVRLRISP